MADSSQKQKQSGTGPAVKLKNLIKQIAGFNWKLFLVRVYQKARQNDIFIHSMGMVYITLLSIVPFLIFAFYIMNLFNFFGRVDEIVEQLRELILANLATGTGDALLGYLETFILNVDIEQLGLISFVSLVAVIVFMLARIEITFNQIWTVEEHRDIFKRFVAFWTFITLGTFVITLALSLGFAFLENYLDVGAPEARFGQSTIFRWIIFSLNFLIFIIAYYFIPNTDVDPGSAVFAGLISGLLFLLSREIYVIYTRNIVDYGQIYGSLSIIPIFLIWLYVIWLIVLLGAVISYVFHHRQSLLYLSDDSQLNNRLQELLPVAILLIIYKNYQQRSSAGVSFRQILQRIHLPENIIIESLKKMKKANLITETSDCRYVPLTKIDDLPLWSFCQPAGLDSDLKIESIFADPEMKKVYQHYRQGMEAELRDLTLAEVADEG